MQASERKIWLKVRLELEVALLDINKTHDRLARVKVRRHLACAILAVEEILGADPVLTVGVAGEISEGIKDLSDPRDRPWVTSIKKK